MAICIGEFSVPLFPQVTMEKRTRLVPGTRTEERKTLKKVLVTRYQEITNGCSNRCAGLSAYTKTSLRRAIKENDLTASGSCYTCGLRALVGEGRKRTESVPFSLMEEIESVETIQVPCMIEETYYVEAQRFQPATLIEKPKITVAPALTAPTTPVTKSVNTEKQSQRIGRQLLENYESGIARAFANIKTHDPVYPQKQTVRRARTKRTEFSAPEHVITSIQQSSPAPTEPSVEKPGRVVFTRATRIAKQYKVVQANEKTLESLLGFLANVARHSTLTIELVLGRKRVNKYRKTMREGSSEFMVTTRHHEGAFREIDVPSDYLVKRMESRLITKSAHRKIHTDTLTYGDSGLLIAHERLLGNFTRHRSGWLIVRGRYEGKVVDSRIRQPRQRVLEIEHYTRSVETRFWTGFDRTFREMRSQHRNHVCESNFDVEECGSVAAIVCQTIFPCGKITCRQCAEQLASNTFHDLGATLDSNIPIALTRLDALYPQFKHVTSLLRMLQRVASAINSNHTAFTEIQRIIGDRTDAPFSNINKINEILIKGNQATSEEFSVATQLLLELARYQRNRTENIKSGSLNSFRNKISGKAHINPTLMCDNQLDTNGNFVWGKRGYHAKRFFANYFEEINPAEGYDKHVVREHPNGARKLAIANLIVSTNFENLRKQLKGEPVELFKLTQQCVSMRRGNFEYPCCCVTLDDGTPFESELKMPTKNHLVVGNSGDSKFVDLPTDASNKMYIAKPGYCYINIFLAMLVNVNEDDAKDFTKMVRDVIVDKLGKWPSMLDVATACFLLRTFFPDVHNAELPRILVDHKTKTMHVIDSYGSLNTGYHVLKANTVSQLILFASDSLESEMKHYLVGGDISISQIETENVKLLIRSIYKPRLMKAVLMEEPYILILSVLSPGVLLALFNSGSLERMVHELIRTDQSVATIATILSALAMKVSLAETLTMQLQVITDQAGALAEVARGDGRTMISRNFALRTLERILARGDAERALTESGYRISGSDIIKTLMEKSYLAELDAAWNALSWSEKFCAIKESYKWRKHIVKSLNPQKDADLNGRYDISVTSLVERARGTMRKYIKETNAKCEALSRRATSYTCRSFVSIVNYLVPDIFKFINVIIVISVLLNITISIKALAREYQSAKLCKLTQKRNEEAKKVVRVHKEYTKLRGTQPTEQEFLEYIESSHPDLLGVTRELLDSLEPVAHQAKRASEVGLERIIAFTSLVLMIFDQDRSDCVYKILTKLKGIMGAIDADVCHQSIDEIQSTFEEKKTTIDFELDSDVRSSSLRSEPTFSDWWSNQLERNNVIPHYRTEGHFMEFTRQNAAKVANDIAHGPHNDIIVRGGVGSGKSTGLPFNLSAKGKVLLLEPTRPLAENVCKQLRGDPFFASPTLRMRGLTSFGSSPIVIMTSGFALHYYAHNPIQLEEFGFVLFDECHVNDSSAMAFRCLLHEYNYAGKIVKVSATPPGREIEYKPQCEVVVAHEVTLSFEQFVAAQGKGTNADVVSRGDNILVYVASYSEVDALSRLLTDKGYKVTKVDGRTMKIGNVEITTHGTPKKKHFIVATNIIENGVTLDIEVVVDFGTKVSPRIDVDCRAIRCGKDGVSYGERIQRLGRVGRHKEGYALKVGTTQKGLLEVPPITATEAAFLCFTYGLPVMTQNVATTFISGCTVKQARTMLQFELPIFYTVHLVRYDGTMHPAIHRLLKPYKLRDSETLLSKLAIPSGSVNSWFTAKLYANMGYPTDLEAEVRVPFYARELPEKLHEQVWNAVKEHKKDAGFGRISSASACKIAYTLKTDVFSVQRTIQVIESLIEKEMEKQAHFRAVIGDSCSNADFTLASIAAAIRARYAKDHTTENIGVLQAALAQLKEFSNLHDDASYAQLGNNALQRDVAELGAMECVLHQSEADIARTLRLKGRWDKSLITRDVLILAGVTGGGVWMLYNYFKSLCTEQVYHQGYNKRQRQKLKFRNAREAKIGREVYGDDGTIEHYFGKAYTEKGKTKGRTHGMGTKNRRFVNMYGYDPADYSFVRFVDPLTGVTIDESPYTSIDLVQEHFSKARMQALVDGELEKEHLTRNNRVEAYYVKNMASNALKVDLTPHNPLLMCKTNTIAGYPEREFELRQTGRPQVISPEQIPQRNETKEEVDHEASSTFRGMRDYNPLASVICQLTNESEGHREIVYGLGFGSMIITNQHLFKRNNGSLSIRSRHGDFTINSIMQLKVAPLAGRDIVLIQLPKDFPPFPQKLKFRPPKSTERVCMVGTLFQERYLSSLVSETSATYPVPNSHFWKHWITTKVGDCGLPLVSTTDGSILGIHSLANMTNTNNYYTTFPDNFASEFLLTPEQNNWTKHWKYNANEVCWGSLCLQNNQPDGMFKVHKLITDLVGTEVYAQSKTHWVASAAGGNLIPLAQCPNQLVTKHVVKGKCTLFETYLQVHPDAKAFFSPLLDAYNKSRLNKEAYLKDILKYATPITIGSVDCNAFDQALSGLVEYLKGLDFGTCVYVTEPNEIFDALNMKSAVGAMYTGKKKEYFADYTDSDKEMIIFQSCKRLFLGKRGLWNGSLKAELRPVEKVEANKTRTFTAAPIDTLLGGKVCVDDFNNRFYSLHLEAPWSVGMTKFYGGWDKLLRSLPDGWIYCDADGSQFDSSLSPYLINAVLQLRLQFMEEWDIGAQMLANLYTEIVYTPISAPDGTVLKKCKGNNSGQPSTVVDNTLMVVLAMYYSLIKAGVPVENQAEICKYFVNGDDLLLAVRPDYEFVLDTFKESFLTLGLKYEFDSRHTEKEKLWFMSHQGKLIDNIYIPKLEQERIVSILQWDRSTEPVHRLEAICAAMIESWGHTTLTHEIRKFYQWILEQAPYNELAKEGKAPYISELALRRLYTNIAPSENEIEEYLNRFQEEVEDINEYNVVHQSREELDAGKNKTSTSRDEGRPLVSRQNDQDVNVGTTGGGAVPRLKQITAKLSLPKVGGKAVMNLTHLLTYTPDQVDLSNARSSHKQFETWYNGVKHDYDTNDEGMSVILNGLMVWCIENGTSPNINGMWVMMDGIEQVEFPIKPLIDHAKPTFRQIMAHFSNVAEAYIEKRNYEKPYMPRYGLQRNLNDMSLARYAFDFYEMTSKTPARAREAHIQMKAAALRNANTRMFGLDGNITTKEEDTERHTADDVNRNMHSLNGSKSF